jgi:hypothetical protein
MTTRTTTTSRRSPSVVVLDEPNLEFGFGQRVISPHDGLSLFGPYERGRPNHPAAPAYLVLGTPEGVRQFGEWARCMTLPAAVPVAKSHRLWPPFPGFEAAFDARWPECPTESFAIDPTVLQAAARKGDPHERCFAVVNLYLGALERRNKLDATVNVAVCVVPDEVYANCRPKSRVAVPSDPALSRDEKASRRRGQGNLFEQVNLDQYHLSPDFRRQLKARAMEYKIPVQLVRESTLRLSDATGPGERRLTPLSDRMWNLSTALYYKCGGKPWRLATARDGVCYVGLAFRRTEEGDRTACCAAQMFLDSGDGVVFLGEFGPWYSPDTRQFHLTRRAARDLLAGVLKTYQELEGKSLKEVFLHSRSTITDDEFAGYREACPAGTKLVGIRVRRDRDSPRLFREGAMPVLRGVFVHLHERAGYLFGAGFKPRLGTYDGWEVPVPLRIDIQHGTAAIDQVAVDILGLTKLNYNACRLGEAEPVTVRFSDAVGEILISNPRIAHESRQPSFRYYI